MGQGQGSISVNQKKEAAAAGGVTGANNGVSLSGANVVLGDNYGSVLSQLTSPRSIKLNNQELIFYQGATEFAEAFLHLDGISASDLLNMSFNTGTNAGGQISEMYNIVSQIFLNHNAGAATSNFTLNDTDVIATHNDGTGNFGTLQLNSTHARLLHTDLLELNNGVGNTFLDITMATGVVRIGDIDSVFNDTLLTIKEPSSSIELKANGIVSVTRVTGEGGLLINFAGTYAIGDLDAIANGMLLEILDGSSVIRFGELAGAGNDTVLSLDDAAKQMNFQSDGGTFLKLDVTAGIYQMGDIDATVNGMRLDILDSTQQFNVWNATGVFLNIDAASQIFSMGNIVSQNSVLILSSIAGAGVVELKTGSVKLIMDEGNNNFHIYDATSGLKITGDAAFLLHTGQAMTDGAGAAAGTLTNAPTAGNPTKWIAIDDNGTTRHIPTWE